MPRESIVYLADRKNAPYGTKNRDTILKIVKNNIKTLKEMGADKILIACCTASTVYDGLTDEERAISLPIIEPAARVAADLGQNTRVVVISTEHTASSHAFSRLIRSYSPSATVTEIPTQMLVSLVELGASDGSLLPRESDYLDRLAARIKSCSANALILGCTHFSSLAGELKARLKDITVINPAILGARALAEYIERANGASNGAHGKITYM